MPNRNISISVKISKGAVQYAIKQCFSSYVKKIPERNRSSPKGITEACCTNSNLKKRMPINK